MIAVGSTLLSAFSELTIENSEAVLQTWPFILRLRRTFTRREEIA